MLLNHGFTSQAIVFRLKKQPEKEKEHQKSSTANQQDWGGRLDGFDQCRVGADHCRYDLEEAEVWIAAPQDEDWEEAPDEEDGDDDSPCEEPLP